LGAIEVWPVNPLCHRERVKVREKFVEELGSKLKKAAR
jgi:hypothetical protein